jgi:hypothetical protein
MAPITAQTADRLDAEAARTPIADVAGYLQRLLGQRMAGYLANVADVKQIGRYQRPDGPKPGTATDRRLRAGFKIVRMIEGVYDGETARAWLFGTNTRLDDRAPIGVLREATSEQDFTDVVRAARAFASADA